MRKLLLTIFGTLLGVTSAQTRSPVLVFISWDGSPGRVIERLSGEGKLPDYQRLADKGVYVKRTVGNWPSVTAAGHAAVFTGAYGNVNGITGNGVPLAPFDEHAIGEDTASGFSADNLLAEPAWRQVAPTLNARFYAQEGIVRPPLSSGPGRRSYNRLFDNSLTSGFSLTVRSTLGGNR